MLNLSLPIGSNFGWGVAGYNIAKAIYESGETMRLLTNQPPFDAHPVWRRVPLGWDFNYPKIFEEPMIHAIQGANFLPMNQNAWSASHNIGYCFIEQPSIAARYRANAYRYFDVIVTGSTWCTEQLRAIGIKAFTIMQGVDHEIFNPGVTPGPYRNPSRFNILSAGKFEYRKGQDIVIAAFRALMDKYPDMHLVCAWENLWPATMDSMKNSKHITYVSLETGKWFDRIHATMALSDIPRSRYTLVGCHSHRDMAAVYKCCDIGLFPNRCEAGTNLPMCEAMACGVPVIASMATGHADVIDFYNSYALLQGSFSEEGWFDASIEETVSVLEDAYLKRGKAGAVAIAGAETIKQFTWERTAKQFLDIVRAGV